MTNDQTFGELYKAKGILEVDLDAAVEAFMADPSLTAFLMGEGYTADLAAAVRASSFAAEMIADAGIKPQSKRNAVRTAILLSRPMKV